MAKIEQKIKELKMALIVPEPKGLYLPAVKTGNLVMTSGQLPIQDQRLMFPGRVGKDVSVENANRCVRAAIINCLGAIKSVIHDLDKIKKIVRLNGYVSSALGFNDQPRVLNAGSELLMDLFGEEIGSHTRCAIGVFELPMSSCVELDLTVEI